MSCANWFSLFVGLPHGAYAYASVRTCMHLRITCRSNTSRCYHRGYYTIASNMTYYTAQLFCKISDNPEAWQNVTSKVNQIMIQGCIQESWLVQLMQDMCNNWDTTYSVNAFLPAKAFDNDKIDATKNRHIIHVKFQGIPWIAELVKILRRNTST